jgi:phage shock protein E
MKAINLIFSLLFLVFTSASVASCQSQLNGGVTGNVEHLNVAQFTEKLEKGKGIILDVRTPEEYAGGNVPGAANIDFYGSQFDAQLQKLDPAKEYYIYCASGNRSGKAARIMAEKGFKKVYSLSNGGYNDLRHLKK